MIFLKKHKAKLLFLLLMIGILVWAFWWGGNAPSLRGWDTPTPPAPTEAILLPEKTEQSEQPEADATATTSETNTPEETVQPVAEEPPVTEENLAYSMQNGMEIDPKTGKDVYHTTPVPEGKPVPVDNSTITDQTRTCTLSVKCDTVLHHMDWLSPEKRELVPADGVILPPTTVTFFDGESVFHLLLREMKKNDIHMEYVSIPIYHAAYIEGIHNLYEFDCGELSGWMYRVNGWVPNYGCSRYQLKENDVVEWIYTCDLGRDIGATL